MLSKSTRIAACVLAASISSVSTTAFGAGFAVAEQSVSGLGTAFAGGSAWGQDASTVWYNPAAMSLHDSAQFNAAGHFIIPTAKFRNAGTTNFAGAAITGGGSDAGKNALVPNVYYSRPMSDKLSFGLGVNAPFGLVTEYSSTWVGRYHAIKSDLMTININPAVSYKVADGIALGVGVSAMYADAVLTQAIDYGGVATAGTGGGLSQALDGAANMAGDDWGYGFNIGLLVNAGERTRLGAHFRSDVKQKLQGTVRYTIPAGAIAAGAAATLSHATQGISANVTLPSTVSGSIYHQLSDKLGLMADVTWTNWEEMPELRIKFNGGAADSVITLNWENTIRVALGATYTASDNLDLHFGYAYDESPIPNAEARSPRIPDSDRHWLTIGGSYRVSENATLDISYAHLIVKDANVAKLAGAGIADEDFFRGSLTGSYEADVDILSASFNWRF